LLGQNGGKTGLSALMTASNMGFPRSRSATLGPPANEAEMKALGVSRAIKGLL
jgi:hypothetical protein